MREPKASGFHAAADPGGTDRGKSAGLVAELVAPAVALAKVPRGSGQSLVPGLIRRRLLSSGSANRDEAPKGGKSKNWNAELGLLADKYGSKPFALFGYK